MYLKTLVFALLTGISLGATASQKDLLDVGLSTNDVKKDFPWALLPTIDDVKSNVNSTLVQKLGLSAEYAKSVPVGRIFTSEWYQVKVDDKVYVVDQFARYWLLVDGSVNFFMFENGVQSINVSNRSRDAMLMARPLFESLLSHMVIYPSLNPNKKDIVYVFMDVNCPHSKKFHLTRRKDLQLAGFEFRYIPFNALSNSSQTTAVSDAIWCAKQMDVRMDLMDKVYLSKNATAALHGIGPEIIRDATCSDESRYAKYVYETFTDVHQLSGTPVFINSSGVVFYGAAAFERGNGAKLNAGRAP